MSKEDQERERSLLKEDEEDQQSIFDRIKAFYPNDQDKKSAGFALRSCAGVIAMDSMPFNRFRNLFLLVPLILWGLMIFAYVFYLALIRSLTGPVFLLALVCLFVFTVVAIFLMVLWNSFWIASGPLGSLVVYMTALAGLMPRVLMLTGNLREPQGLFLRGATDAIFICCFTTIYAVLAVKIYDLGMDAIRNRALWERPVPRLLWALFKALEGVSEPTDSLWLDPSIRSQPLNQLENAALCLEFFQQRFVDSRFASIPDVRQYYLRRAAGLRKLKMRAILPTPNNLIYLQQEIRRVLDLAAAGDWDELPTADLPTIAPLSWLERALKMIRFLAFAFLPAVAVSVMDAHHRLPAQFGAYIVPVAWMWAILNVLSALDPRFGEKLSAFRNLPDFLALGQKSKEDKELKL
jgi:hypothetical protein